MNPLALQCIARRGFVPAAVYVLAAAFLAQSAVADQYDTLNLVMSDSLTYDANVFRTPDSIGPQPGFSTKSDNINVSNVGLRINKPYAQQRFQFDATKSMTRYKTFSFLDSEALNYRGAWLWALTPHLTGTLSTDRAQSQIPFTQIGGTQSNVRTTNSRNFNLDGWVSGAWHLLAGVGQTESKTEQAILSLPSSRSNRVEAGLRYAAASGNSVTFTQRSITADVINQPLDPVNLIDTNYRDTESELKVNWKPSGHSTIDSSLTRKERRNEHFAQRDFSGYAGELRYGWTPTGKLQFNLVASRTILPYAAFGNTIQNSTYQVNQALSLGSVWQVHAKTAVRLNFVRTLSDYRGPVFAVTGPAQHDDFRSAQLGVDWAVTRYLSLSASLQRDRRSSNVARLEFTDTVATVSAALTF